MKKIQIYLGFPLLGLLLAGCSKDVGTMGDPDYWCKYDNAIPAFASRCRELAEQNAPIEQMEKAAKVSIVLILFVLILILGIYLLILRYVWITSIRTGRSRLGFMLLAIFFPVLSWVILLVIDVDESRKPRAMTEKPD